MDLPGSPRDPGDGHVPAVQELDVGRGGEDVADPAEELP